MEQKTHKINSLSQYINLIKNEKLQSCYYRGENRKYNSILSTLLREFSPTHDVYGLGDIYNNLLSEYYQEVGNDLDSFKKENFLAFSQHHGLKTNLVDFTTAPLVALYFACAGNTDNKGNGYIYLLRKESTVDATNFLSKFSVHDRNHINIYGKLASQDSEVIKEYKWVLERYEGLLSGKNPYDLVNDMILLMSGLSYCKKCHEYISKRRDICKKGVDGICKIPDLMKQYYPTLDILGGMAINEFIFLLMLFFDDISHEYCFEPLPNDITFPRVPYLMYRTPLKFDRIRNQCGVFLYQGFLDYWTNLDDMGGLMIQKIVPDFVVEVHNQDAILQELDLVGINKMFIYGDFDSAAQYINHKHYR